VFNLKQIDTRIAQLEASQHYKLEKAELNRLHAKRQVSSALSSPWVLGAAFGIGWLAARIKFSSVASKTASTLKINSKNGSYLLGKVLIGPLLTLLTAKLRNTLG